MITSLLNDILLLKNQPEEKLIDYLKAANLTIFDNIIAKYTPREYHQIINYIFCAFSEDSPMLILRQDSKEEKEGICEYLQIPEYLCGQLMGLTDSIVKKAAIQYVEQFAGYEFKTLMLLKIQHDDFMRDITNRNFPGPVKKSDGEDEENEKIEYYYDIKEHGKALKELQMLAKSITQIEDQLKNKVRHSAIDEIKDWRHRGKGKNIKLGTSGISIENSTLITKRSNG